MQTPGVEVVAPAARRKTKREGRMEAAVVSLQRYMNTYPNQPGYANYSDTTFIDDVLYGLGLALGASVGAKGYNEFKATLRKHLGTGNEATGRGEGVQK